MKQAGAEATMPIQSKWVWSSVGTDFESPWSVISTTLNEVTGAAVPAYPTGYRLAVSEKVEIHTHKSGASFPGSARVPE
jgi:hypothetical protein